MSVASKIEVMNRV